eukprot:COSAG01_NODE_70532_length_258_cov_0.672956_1_plen_43_part_10
MSGEQQRAAVAALDEFLTHHKLSQYSGTLASHGLKRLLTATED